MTTRSTFQFRDELADLLCEEYGRSKRWPHEVKASFQHIATVNSSLGMNDFELLLDCAIDALERHSPPAWIGPPGPVPGSFAALLKTTLAEREGGSPSPAMALGAHALLGVHNVLGDRDLAQLLRYAKRACEPDPSPAERERPTGTASEAPLRLTSH